MTRVDVHPAATPRGPGPRRIAVVHNRYQQRGGEDYVFDAETAALEAGGHHVVRYEVHNDDVGDDGRLSLALKTVWNVERLRTLTEVFRRERVEVVHVHNTLPLISPAVYLAARRAGAGVVQTLHNYRLLCPVATLHRAGRTCEECVGKLVAWPGVKYACYRGDRAATAVVAATTAIHKVNRTYHRWVDRFIALSHFAKQKFIEGGLPSERIVVKPNAIPLRSEYGATPGGPAVFLGRLTDEKGIPVMLAAWRHDPDLPPLRILGDGPLRTAIEAHATGSARVTAPGHVAADTVHGELTASAMLVFPSTCYENSPMAVIEAMAAGVPVVASRRGALPELVIDGVTGLLFEPGDAFDLATKVRWLRDHPSAAEAMGRKAREAYEASYTPGHNLRRLEGIYEEAVTSATRRGGS